MRLFQIFAPAFAAVVLSISTAAADESALVTPDDLRAYAAAGDHAGLDAALDEMQTAVMAGTVTARDQRRTYAAFETTKPEMHAFIRTWLAASPGSKHARAAQALLDRHIAWLVRGAEYATKVYPDALEIFNRLGANAVRNALSAFEDDPAFLPASDVLLRMANSRRSMVNYRDVLARVMDVHPNYGSVRRAMVNILPGWGGKWRDAEYICDTYASAVPDRDGYSVGVCKLEASICCFNDADLSVRLAAILDEEEGEIQDALRPYDAAYLRLGLPKNLEAAIEQMEKPGFLDLELAKDFDFNVGGRLGLEPFGRVVLMRLREKAKVEIEHDPYNPDLLEHLSAFHYGSEVFEDAPTPDLIFDYARRALAFQPYNKLAWIELSRWARKISGPFAYTAREAYERNAIVYSNHSAATVEIHAGFWAELIVKRRDMYNPAAKVPEWQKPLYPGSELEAADEDVLLCNWLRAKRVLDAICADPGNSECAKLLPSRIDLVALLQDIEQRGICKDIIAAPVEALLYTPANVEDVPLLPSY